MLDTQSVDLLQPAAFRGSLARWSLQCFEAGAVTNDWWHFGQLRVRISYSAPRTYSYNIAIRRAVYDMTS